MWGNVLPVGDPQLRSAERPCGPPSRMGTHPGAKGSGGLQGTAAGIRELKYYGNKTYSARKTGKRLEKSTAKDLEMAAKDTKQLDFT